MSITKQKYTKRELQWPCKETNVILKQTYTVLQQTISREVMKLL